MIELKSLEEAIEFKAPPQVQITSITDVMKTPGSDRLHSFTLAGGWTIFSSNINQGGEGEFGEPRFKVGDKVVYFALDSVLPAPLEEALMGNSKMKLDKGRIRIAKLRGAYSEGMIAEIDEMVKLFPAIKDKEEGEELAHLMGVVKYEPPAYSIPGAMKGGALTKKNKHFSEYIDVRHLKHYLTSDVFEVGEEVYVTVKLHGTSARYGMLPTHVPPIDFSSFKGFFKTFKKKVLQMFNLLPPFEYCIGSRRCQLQNKPDDYKTFYDTNVYRIVSDKFQIESKLKPGEILFGEIVGEGIQKNYDYGFTEKSPFGRYGFFAYDVMVNGRYLPAKEFLSWCNERGVVPVPVLGFLPYDVEKMRELAGAKVCHNAQKIREGVVIKSVDEKSHPACGRRVFKLINPKYLEADNTDFH